MVTYLDPVEEVNNSKELENDSMAFQTEGRQEGSDSSVGEKSKQSAMYRGDLMAVREENESGDSSLCFEDLSDS
jgi:hypothetical protein